MKNKKRGAALLLALIASLGAQAQDNSELVRQLKQCEAESQAQRRLACFEDIVKALRQAEPDPQTAQAASASASAPPPGVPDPNPMRRVIDRSIEPSYVGIGSGIRLRGDQSSRPLLYEGQIVKNVELTEDIELGKMRLRLDLPLRFVVRQFNVESKPVRTPTYNPGLRAYLYEAPDKREENVHVFSAGLFHYSNGQEGASLEPDGSVNTLNGSFSTNYLELAWMRMHTGSKQYWLQDWRLSLRQHFYGTWDDAQVKQYPRRELRAQARIAKDASEGLLPELRVGLGYRAGFGWRVWNWQQPEANVKLRTRDRFQVSLELLNTLDSLKFGKDSDLGLYARFDLGYDDYNINFGRRMNRFTVGFNAKL